MKRGQSSGRKDDNPEAFVKRYYGMTLHGITTVPLQSDIHVHSRAHVHVQSTLIVDLGYLFVARIPCIYWVQQHIICYIL